MGGPVSRSSAVPDVPSDAAHAWRVSSTLVAAGCLSLNDRLSSGRSLEQTAAQRRLVLKKFGPTGPWRLLVLSTRRIAAGAKLLRSRLSRLVAELYGQLEHRRPSPQ